MIPFLKRKVGRVEYLRQMLGPFAAENKDLIVIVADPESDYMFVAYKNKMVLGKVKSVDGQQMNVVRGVVKQSVLKSKFDEAMDLFTAGMIDLLKLGVKEGNQFYKFIADVLFNFQDRSKAWLEKQAKVEQILSADNK